MVDAKAEGRKQGGTEEMKMLGKDIRKGLYCGRRSTTEEAGEKTERHVERKDWRGVRHNLDESRKEFECLLDSEPPPGDNILVNASPLTSIVDEIPLEGEIELAINLFYFNSH